VLSDEEPSEWFKLTTGPQMKYSSDRIVLLTVYSSLFQEGINVTLANIETVNEKTQKELGKAVSTEHIKDADDAEFNRILNIAVQERIKYSIVYDVGQGNSIGLCDEENFPQVYFDLGGGIGPNLFTFPKTLGSFCFTRKPAIILSHWDEDHWSSALRSTSALSLEWIVPRQKLTAGSVALLAAITKAKGTIWFVPVSFAGAWFGQIHLELCNGSNKNNSGIALTLSEQTRGVGRQILMPGDAEYRYVPTVKRGSQYHSIVAPHHGGILHSNPIIASSDLPTCSLSSAPSYPAPARITAR
jgi:hypothetical protein